MWHFMWHFYFQTYDNKTPAVFQITSGLLLVSSLLRVSPDSRGSACGKMVKLFKLRVAVWGEAGVSVLTSHWSPAIILASDWPTLTRPSSSRNIHSAPAGPRPHRPAKHKESQINMPQASGLRSPLKSQESGIGRCMMQFWWWIDNRKCCKILRDSIHLNSWGIWNCNSRQLKINQDERGLIWDSRSITGTERAQQWSRLWALISAREAAGPLCINQTTNLWGSVLTRKGKKTIFLADTSINAL